MATSISFTRKNAGGPLTQRTILVQLEGISGNDYEFLGYPIGTELARQARIYAFARLNRDNLWEIIYIGETQDFSDRAGSLTGHHKWWCIEMYEATYVFLHQVWGGKDDLLLIEADLIENYDPPCND